MGNRGTFMFSSKKTAFVMSRWSGTPLRWSCRRHSVWYEGENDAILFESTRENVTVERQAFWLCFFFRYSLHFIIIYIVILPFVLICICFFTLLQHLISTFYALQITMCISKHWNLPLIALFRRAGMKIQTACESSSFPYKSFDFASSLKKELQCVFSTLFPTALIYFNMCEEEHRNLNISQTRCGFFF